MGTLLDTLETTRAFSGSVQVAHSLYSCSGSLLLVSVHTLLGVILGAMCTATPEDFIIFLNTCLLPYEEVL